MKMIQLQIVAPPTLSTQVLQLLTDTPPVTNIVVLRDAGQQPDGDVIRCDIANEEASAVIADLRDMELNHDGSIAIGPTKTELSEFAANAEQAAPGYSSDAVVWELVEEQTAESAELSGSFLLFMVIAVLIATIGIYLNSPILVIGAMNSHRYRVACCVGSAVFGRVEARYEAWTAGRPAERRRPALSRC